MEYTIFIELTLLLVFTLFISALMRFFKQPLILGYIISGIFVGPLFLNLVQSTDFLKTFAQLGVVFLLFIVGLNLNPKVIKEVGKISILAGIGQVILTLLLGYGIAKLLGFTLLESAYIAAALTFSSTIIIMKILSDKKDLETLYGRISMGILIIQDLVVIFILIMLSAIQSSSELPTLIIESLLKAGGVFIILYLLSKYLLPRLISRIAKSQEFLLLFSLAWCFTLATVFAYLEFSIEAGALLAGISLSFCPYHIEISSKMKPLRDFFVLLFFVLLGSQMIFGDISHNLLSGIIFSLFILIGKPLLVMILMGMRGYTKRNGFMTGITLGQISEFSLVLTALGVSLGHISVEIFSLITFIGIITIAGSTSMILYANQLYNFFSPLLTFFEKKGKKVDEHYQRNKKYDIILFGYNRIGFDILESVKKIKKTFIVIDYNPEVVHLLAKKEYPCRYGDVNDTELLDTLDFSKVKMIISTIPVIETNLLLLNKVRESNTKIISIMVSHQIEEATQLYSQGATYVMMPHFLGGSYISTMIEKNKLSMQRFLKEKMVHLSRLQKKKSMGHEHPKHETN